MSYSAEINRDNPSCFLFLLDQSGSMRRPIGNLTPPMSKAQMVADVINKLLQNLVIKCARTEGVRDYFHIVVIGYSSAHVKSVLPKDFSNRTLIPISELAEFPLRIDHRKTKISDGAGGLVEQEKRFPVWLDPYCCGATPMCEAIRTAKDFLDNWLNDHYQSFPPTVINISDGEATDGNPQEPADQLKALKNSDGNVSLYNIHVSDTAASPIEFPDNDKELPDTYSKMLFGMSSILPENIRISAEREEYRVSENTRGFTFNADAVALVRFLDIGTRPSNMR